MIAAIASANPTNAGRLRACLQQTGLVDSVVECSPSAPGEWQASAKQCLPDVLILDIDRHAAEFFALSADLRKSRPALRVIACSEQSPQPDLLLEAMRSGVQEFLPSPLDLTTLRNILQGFLQESAGAEREQTSRLIVVTGAKGGVGTSTLAVNLGVQISALKKQRTLLLDLGQPVGHASLLLDLRPRFTVWDALDNIESLDSHFFSSLLTKHRSGLEVLAGLAHPEQRLSAPGVSRLINVAQTTGEIVLMDFGVRLSSEWRELLNHARTILLVAEANVCCLWSLERQLSAMADLAREPGRIRIVINRWSRKDDSAIKSFEKNSKHSVFARIPNDFGQVSEAMNLGVPLFKNHNNSLLASVRQLALQLAGEPQLVPDPSQRNGLSRLFTFSKAKREDT